jgi:hypothetical protein
MRLPPRMVPVYLVMPFTSLGQCPLHRTTYPNPRQPWQSLSFPNTRCRMNQSTRQEGPLKPNPLAYHQKQCTLHYHHQNITHSLTTPHDSGVLEERLLPTWSYGTKLFSTPNNKNVCTVAEQISSIGHWRPSSLNFMHIL